MNTQHIFTGPCLLALILSTVSCSGSGSNTGLPPNPSASSGSEDPSNSLGSASSEATGTGSATAPAEPVSTNDLILIDFPAVTAPPNQYGNFTDFGESSIGFLNPRDKAITIGNVEVVNITGEPFSLTRDECSSRTLSKGESCFLRVEFRPATPPGRSVPYTGQLIIHMPAHNTYQVLELTGGTAAISSPIIPVPTIPSPTVFVPPGPTNSASR
jgi:hypothetical protein